MVFGLSEPTAIFCFLVSLVQLVSVFPLRLDISTVNWTPRLDGALDISSQRCIGHLVSMVHWTSRILLGLYPWDLKNPTNKTCKLVSSIDYVVTQSPKSQTMA